MSWSVLHWPDGTVLHAEIQPGQDAIDALHDAAHEVVARAMGLERSPILATLVGAAETPRVERALEEAAVLAVQALARYRLDLK
jgi:hypothetical protein